MMPDDNRRGLIMNTSSTTALSPTIESRLAACVAKKMGCETTFVRWDLDLRTGASIPVFSVPMDRRDDAAALGLRVA